MLKTGFVEPVATGERTAKGQYVHIDNLMKTPQFYLLWGSVFGNAVAGISIISCAKTIFGEVFSGVPGLDIASMGTLFVASLSAGNMFGRSVLLIFSLF